LFINGYVKNIFIDNGYVKNILFYNVVVEDMFTNNTVIVVVFYYIQRFINDKRFLIYTMESTMDFETADEIQTLVDGIFDLIPKTQFLRIRKCKEETIKKCVILGEQCLWLLRNIYEYAAQSQVLVVPTSVLMSIEKEFDLPTVSEEEEEEEVDKKQNKMRTYKEIIEDMKSDWTNANGEETSFYRFNKGKRRILEDGEELYFAPQVPEGRETHIVEKDRVYMGKAKKQYYLNGTFVDKDRNPITDIICITPTEGMIKSLAHFNCQFDVGEVYRFYPDSFTPKGKDFDVKVTGVTQLKNKNGVANNSLPSKDYDIDDLDI